MTTKSSSSFVDRIILPIYRFLISLKLAVILLFLLMGLLIAGTIIESLHGATTAKILIYDAAPMSIVMFLLACNVLSVALSRLPWQKKHIGFVLTHLGVILILIGSLITRYTMVDGQMILSEGETGSHLILPEPLVEVRSESTGKSWIYTVSPKPFPWEGKEKLAHSEAAPFDIYLTRFYPMARGREELVPAEAGPAAIQVTLNAPMMSDQFWMVEEDPASGTLNLGPVRLVFGGKLLDSTPEKQQEHVTLHIQHGEKVVHFEFPEQYELPLEIPIEGTSYVARVERVLRQATVAGRDLMDRAEGDPEAAWLNPAVRVVVEGEGNTETHTAFSKFPDFATLHGAAPEQTKFKITMHAPESDAKMAENELRFAVQDDGRLFYQILDGDQISSHEIVPGTTYETAWMGMTFKVDAFYPHARMERSFEPRSNISKADDDVPAIQVRLEKGGQGEDVWLESGSFARIFSGGERYRLLFGRKRQPLGFSLRLKDFIKQTYPGTNKPASFSSDVTMIDAMRGHERDLTISMNEPLEYRGYKIYQSAYRDGVPGQPEISIFSVGKDPGIPLQYTGSAVMVIGIVTMILLQRRKKGR